MSSADICDRLVQELRKRSPLPWDRIRPMFPLDSRRHIHVALQRLIVKGTLKRGRDGFRLAPAHLQGQRPSNPDADTAIFRLPKPAPESWWVAPTDAEFSAKLKTRASLMGWNS